MKKGFLHFHQGWTDIINCLPLIRYYSKIYDELVVLNKLDAKHIIDFFCKDIENVKPIYLSREVLDEESNGRIHLLGYLTSNNILNILEYDLLIHGFPDHYRVDKYKSIYPSRFNTCHFVQGFYTHYQIPYETRINMFEFTRDMESENKYYEDFVSKNGNNYALYHDDPSRNMGVSLPISKNPKYTYVNLHGIADNIFNTIKIIENAKEIHLVDSVWASFCYMVDCRYRTFKDINVYLYPLINRPGGCLQFTPNLRLKYIDPVNLNNWTIINYY